MEPLGSSQPSRSSHSTEKGTASPATSPMAAAMAGETREQAPEIGNQADDESVGGDGGVGLAVAELG